MDFDLLKSTANEIAVRNDADVILYNGDIERPFDNFVIDLCKTPNRRNNVLFILCTRGGNPDAAFRLARCLQDRYKKFSILIAGKCKSSGTLIALGAHEMIMSCKAELGPLDIQLGKKDELFETDSGLTILNALSELENKAFELFENSFIKLKIKSNGRITLKTATGLANELAVGMLAPIMSQVDPLHVGEVSRAMKIGKEYGERLSKVSKNLKPNALHKLVNDYPSHGFVIDKKECEDLFENVRDVNELESRMLDIIGNIVIDPKGDEPLLLPLSDWKEETGNEDNQPSNSGEGGGSDNPPAGDVDANIQGHQPDPVEPEEDGNTRLDEEAPRQAA